MLLEYNGTRNTPTKITINLLNFKEIIKIGNNIYILHLGEKLKDAIEIKISDEEECEYFYEELKNKIEQEIKEKNIPKLIIEQTASKLEQYESLIEELKKVQDFEINKNLEEEIYRFLKEA